MFDLINFMDFCKYMHIMNLMPTTRFKNVGTRGNKKLGKLWNAQKHLFVTFYR